MEEQKVTREWMKTLRKGKGKQIRDMAADLGMSIGHLSDIENGRRNPSIELSMKMAQYFGMDVSIFLKDRVKFGKEVS
jgi:transcriptional regulator with XRE-family HTH domain